MLPTLSCDVKINYLLT